MTEIDLLTQILGELMFIHKIIYGFLVLGFAFCLIYLIWWILNQYLI